MAEFSTGLRNQLLVSGSLKSILDGGLLKVYAGATMPASADAALPGDETLMYTFTVDNDGSTPLTFATAAENGVLLKTATESWQGVAAATGDMAYFRYVKSPDTGADASTTAPRIQGTVGTAFADLIVSNVTKTSGDPLALDLFGVAIPARWAV